MRGARCSTLPALARYVRHRPEDTVLCGVVEVRRDSFYRALEEQGTSLPAFVHGEFGPVQRERLLAPSRGLRACTAHGWLLAQSARPLP